MYIITYEESIKEIFILTCDKNIIEKITSTIA